MNRSADGESQPRARLAVASRLARREVRRHPWRHLLVIALIFVPVLAALVAFSALATGQASERRQQTFSGAPPGTWMTDTDTRTGTGSQPEPLDADDPASIRQLNLPAGTTIETSWNGADYLVTDTERSDGNGPLLVGTRLVEAPEASAAAGRFVVDEGRLPRAADEIFLTHPIAKTNGWKVGDTVELARSGAELRVVGTGVDGARTDDRTAAVGHLPDSYWTDVPDRLSDVQIEAGYSTWGGSRQVVVARTPDGTRPPDDGWYWSRRGGTVVDQRVGPGLTLAAAAICAVVAIVASAAFAISSRRQLRSVGLLSTVGADPNTIRWAMVLQGAIPGVIAGLAAVVVGLIAVAVVNTQTWLEQLFEVEGARAVLSVGGAAIAVALGLGSGLAAAWQPARTVSRIPTLSALAGRRPLGPVPGRVPLAGLALWVVGAILLIIGFSTGSSDHGLGARSAPFLLIGGVAAMALGGVGLAPVLVAMLDPLADRVRGTARMSLRGLARHRTQSAATVAAIAVVLALPVGLLTTRNALHDRNPDEWTERPYEASIGDGSGTISNGAPTDLLRSPQTAQVELGGALRSPEAADVITEIRTVLGPDGGQVRTIPIVDQDGDWQKVAIIDDALAQQVLVPWAATAIADGKAVAIGTDPDDGPVTFTAAGEHADFETVRAANGGVTYLPGGEASYLVGAAAMGHVGAERPADSMLFFRAEPLDAAERTSLERFSPEDAGFDVPTLAEVRQLMAGDEAAEAVVLPEDVYVYVNGGVEYESGSTFPAESPTDLTSLRWQRALMAAAAVATGLALLVLAITLSLRAVDGQADLQAAFAAGVAPGRLRHQRAFEGVVLALLGALLALPLGWLPVMAARIGADSDLAGNDSTTSWITGPGWMVVPVLLVPAVLAAVLWTVLPGVAAAVRNARHRGPADELLPRF